MSSLDFSGKNIEQITDFDRKVYESISKGQWLPNAFKQYIVEYLALNQPLIPFGQLVGAQQFTAKVAPQIVTNETTTSLTYGDLATVGPTLSDLSDGSYFVLFSSEARNTTANDGAVMSLSFNGGAAGDGDAAYTFANLVQTTMGFTVVDLEAGSNEIVAKYRADVGGTAEFQRRKLVAFKYANL